MLGKDAILMLLSSLDQFRGRMMYVSILAAVLYVEELRMDDAGFGSTVDSVLRSC
jgi:hypothetical protein